MKISQYNKWSIRRLKVGAASVMIASGSIVALGQSHIVSADEIALKQPLQLQQLTLLQM
ncbi:TPA: YSIRK-type signal peptide-containing protein [Streptococcus agalactiae]|nr:YSIRK-type signal peptide-containing protein [Streptococcus agalactiae]